MKCEVPLVCCMFESLLWFFVFMVLILFVSFRCDRRKQLMGPATEMRHSTIISHNVNMLCTIFFLENKQTKRIISGMWLQSLSYHFNHRRAVEHRPTCHMEQDFISQQLVLQVNPTEEEEEGRRR